MNKLKNTDLVEFVKSKIGTPYIYGSKGSEGIFTEKKLNFLIDSYPEMFTKSYIEKSKKFIGQVCTDCSGLISWFTKKNIGSYQLYETSNKKLSIDEIENVPVGTILWKQGHVGVYIGNGECVEAKGISYGTVKSKVKSCKFTHILFFDYIDYGVTETKEVKNTTYKIKVTAYLLNVRESNNSNSKIKSVIKQNETYTISQVKDGWGMIPNKGWINLSYTKKV